MTIRNCKNNISDFKSDVRRCESSPPKSIERIMISTVLEGKLDARNRLERSQNGELEYRGHSAKIFVGSFEGYKIITKAAVHPCENCGGKELYDSSNGVFYCPRCEDNIPRGIKGKLYKLVGISKDAWNL